MGDTFTKEQVDQMVKDAIAEKGLIPQDKVNEIVQERLARDRRTNFSDYDELKKFKSEHEKALEQKNQKDLEEQKKYEEAKKGYESQIGDLSSKITERDNRIRDMQISSSLSAEINSQNAYLEETLALLKGQAVLDDNGVVKIKTKDANGIETQLTIEEGVKQFLAKRPHLVKSGQRGGGGTPPGTPPGGGGGGAEDLTKLNNDYQQALMTGRYKEAREIKDKILKNFSERNVNRDQM